MTVVTLALGLAAVSIMFTVINTVLLRPLPFAKSDLVVTISQKVPILSSSPTVVTAAEFQEWRKTGLFESSALVDSAEYTLEAQGHPERIYGATVTADFFRVFGLQPLLGRGFTAEDAIEGHDGVIVLSHELWVRRFEGRPDVIGRTIRLSGQSPTTVVGVMPAGFDFPRLADVSTIVNWAPEKAEFWTPLVLTPKVIEEGNFNYYAIGRLRNGESLKAVAAQFRGTAAHLFKGQETRYPQYKELIEAMLSTLVVYVQPLRETMSWGIRDILWMLLTAVALLLALVLFNLGNLLLTQNAHRQSEYTVRQALGASRWQLFRQSTLEQLVMVGLASVFATALTSWGIELLRAAAGDKLPRLNELRFDFASVALLLAIALLTAILFGALSQLILSQTLLTSALNLQSRTSTSDRRTNRWKSLLMIAELAMSVVLLVGAGLLLKSFKNVMQEKPGFDPQHVLTVKVSFDPKRTDKPEKRLQHVRELLDQFRGLPEVTSASLVSRLPLTGDNEIHNVKATGKPLPKQTDRISAEYRVIDAAYFRTMRIPLLAGRDFRADDPASFAVINQVMATYLWPGETAIGKQFADGEKPPVQVIGVVANVHNGSLEKPEMMQFYRLITADPYYADTFVIRSANDPESLTLPVQKIVWKLDASEPVTHAQTMERLLDAVMLQRRFETGLVSSFAAIALFLSALGLFGVASLSAARRTREFGIRLALGASTAQIVQLQLWRTAAMVVGGLGAGLLLSLATAQLLARFLYRVAPWNGEIFAVASLVLVASAMLAGWLPARRAARTDPAGALRTE